MYRVFYYFNILFLENINNKLNEKDTKYVFFCSHGIIVNLIDFDLFEQVRNVIEEGVEFNLFQFLF